MRIDGHTPMSGTSAGVPEELQMRLKLAFAAQMTIRITGLLGIGLWLLF
jgi:hypothetical protein